MRNYILLFIFILPSFFSSAQKDTLDDDAISKMVTLSEVVIRSDMNVTNFIKRVKNDTSFYKAFKNLRVLGFTSLNDIRMFNKKGKTIATLQSKTQQEYANGCRTMQTINETTTGDMYDEDKEFNYYTAELYAALFFTKGKICGETNVVGRKNLNPKEKSGMDKHKEQLKMLFFNPGKKIPGIPFIGDKSNIFSPPTFKYYDMSIDFADYNEKQSIVFSVKAKENLTSSEKNNIVFDNMTTWFDAKTMQIVKREYSLSYNTGVYSFNVRMEAELTMFRGLLVPHVLRYNGTWNVVFKKRESGVFTATLFGFKK